MWIYIGDQEHPFNLFHYTRGRSREGPKQFLKRFNRFLQGDCFSGNEAICAEFGAILVACNAHARRYFTKALLNYRTKSEEALRLFRQHGKGGKRWYRRSDKSVFHAWTVKR